MAHYFRYERDAQIILFFRYHNCLARFQQRGIRREGWYEGTGQVAIGDKRRLDVDWTMYCQDGSTVDFTSYIIANRAKKIQIYGGDGFQDITLHRVSK